MNTDHWTRTEEQLERSAVSRMKRIYTDSQFSGISHFITDERIPRDIGILVSGKTAVIFKWDDDPFRDCYY